LHEILKFVTGNHRKGWSFNGAFDSSDILFVQGRVFIGSVKVPFDADSCAKDYYKLYEIWGVLSGAPLALPRATPPALLLPPTNLTMTHHTSLA